VANDTKVDLRDIVPRREIAHRIHLKTLSFAEHKTLNEFYDGSHPLGRRLCTTVPRSLRFFALDIPYVTNKYKGILYLRSCVRKWSGLRLIANRLFPVLRLPCTETFIDEIVGLYQNTLIDQSTLQ